MRNIRTLSLVLMLSPLTPTHAFASGEASGGGEPELVLVECDGPTTISARGQTKLTDMKAMVADPELTPHATYVFNLDYQVTTNSVDFFPNRNNPWPPKDQFALTINSIPNEDGNYAATVTIARKSKNITCSILNERFRPLANRQVEVGLMYGGERCDATGCVGTTSGPTMEVIPLTLSFNPDAAQLEARWESQREVHGEIVIFDYFISWKRDEEPAHVFTIKHKNSSQRTQFVSVGLTQKVSMETPKIRLNESTLSIWQKMNVTPKP